MLVRIAYAGVNGGCETFRVRGTEYTPWVLQHPDHHPFAPPTLKTPCPTYISLLLRRFARNQTASSYVLGAEGSGTVVAVGEDVHKLKVLSSG